jgi:methyl-accepting chemotaxis protein
VDAGTQRNAELVQHSAGSATQLDGQSDALVKAVGAFRLPG